MAVLYWHGVAGKSMHMHVMHPKLAGKGKPVTRLYHRPVLLSSAACCCSRCFCRAACFLLPGRCLVVPAGGCAAAFRIFTV